MGDVLRNLVVVNPVPGDVCHGELKVQGAQVTAVPPAAESAADTTANTVAIPGLVCGHTHLYSALALGMPQPRRVPGCFVEILEEVWWKLDRALDEESVFMSALVGAARAALCGTTTLVDHHASPNCIGGSLDLVKKAVSMVGLRAVLCYETTDRNGMDGARAGIRENERFLEANGCGRNSDGWFAGMAGGHASFTVGDESLDALAAMAAKYDTGVHIHCAEDAADEAQCRKDYGIGLLERMRRHNVLLPRTILAHGTHLSPADLSLAPFGPDPKNSPWFAHNPRSNMNNAVGYAPVDAMPRGRVALGTDGIDGDMFAESKTAFFKTRDARANSGIVDALSWLDGAARMASDLLGVRLGGIEAGAPADLVLLDYAPGTQVKPDNILGHWFFGVGAQHVRSVMVGGNWVVRDGQIVNPEVREQLARAPEVAARLWERFSRM